MKPDSKGLLAGFVVALMLGGATLAVARISSLTDAKNSERSRAAELKTQLNGTRATVERLDQEVDDLKEHLAKKNVRDRKQINSLRWNLDHLRQKLEYHSCFLSSGDDSSPFRERAKRADIDGDGLSDSIFLEGRLRGKRKNCAYTLKVTTATGTHSARFRGDRPMDKYATDLGFLYELNGAPGFEILVRMVQGATGAEYLAYTLEDGQLVPLAEAGEPTGFADFQSAMFGENSDCVREGGIVVSDYHSTGTYKRGYRMHVEREFFQVRGSRLISVRGEKQVVPHDTGKGHYWNDRFPEFQIPLVFLHCPHPPGQPTNFG